MRKQRQRGRKGDGTVFQTKSGTWRAEISIGSGRARRRIARFAPTEAAAVEALRRLRSENENIGRSGDVPSLESAIAAWLANAKSRIRPKSWVTYELILRLHVVEQSKMLAAMKIDRIKPVHIRELFESLEAIDQKTKEPKTSTRVRELVYLRLRSVFAAHIGEAITKNPVQIGHRPLVERKTMSVWTQAEAKTFLDATKDSEFSALYRLALSVGMRRGELLGLRWSDVDLKARRIHVQHTLTEDGKTLGNAKTTGSLRTIELPSRAAEALAAQKAGLLTVGLRASPWVFPNLEDGTGMPARKLTRIFKADVAAASVPAIRFHDLRHTCATLRLQAGDHPKVVSEMLGHGSVAITLTLYSHVLPSLQRESADRFDAVL